MFSLISLCVAVSLLSGLTGQQILNGSCASFDVSPLQDFDSGLQVTGVWYLYATYDEGLPWHNYDCISFTSDPILPNVIYTVEMAKSKTTEQYEFKPSTMYFQDPRIGVYDYSQGDASTTTQIIYTDLLTYIEFTCTDQEANQSDCYVGIFTRDAVPEKDQVDEINQFLDSHSIDRSSLRDVDQNLFYCAIGL